MKIADDNRWLTFPVHFDDWQQILLQIGVSTAAPSGGGKKGSGRGRAATGAKFTEPIRRQMLRVTDKLGFCVVWPDRATLVDMNNALKTVVRMGCTRDGGFGTDEDGTLRYIRLSPNALQVTPYTIDRNFPQEFRERLTSLLESDPPLDLPPSADARPFVMIWANPEFTVRSTIIPFHELDDITKKNVLGDPVPTVESEDPFFVLVVSETSKKCKEVENGLRARLAKHVKQSRTLRAPHTSPDPEHLHALETGVATVMWIDGKVSERATIALSRDVQPDRLFLLADAHDAQSVGRARDLAAYLGVAPDQVIEIHQDKAANQGALDKVTEKVLSTLERRSKKQEAQRQSRLIWEHTKKNVEQMLDDEAIDAEIIESAVLKPFKKRVVDLLHGKISGGTDAETNFVLAATPLYEQAELIYALNTDRFAGFSRLFSEDMRKRFLNLCPTVRLFLYSNPESFFDNFSELDTQARHYCTDNNPKLDVAKLLVGDLDLYQQAFGRINEDVAFIRLKSKSWYRFTLSDRNFAAVRLEEDKVKHDPLYRRLIDLSDEIYPGRMKRISPAKAKAHEFAYLCWQVGLEADPNCERHMLELFRHNNRSGAHRIITFQNDGPIDTQIEPKKLKRIFLNVTKAIQDGHRDFQRRFGLKSIEFGSQKLTAPETSRRPAQFDLSEKELDSAGRRYILILHFDTELGMEGFSKSDEVKEIRKNLYRDIFKERRINVDDGDLDKIAEIVTVVGNRYVKTHEYVSRHDLIEMLAHLSESHSRLIATHKPEKVSVQ